MVFNQIDIAIEKFVSKKNISISTDPHSDWLVFDWRQLTWKKNGIDYLIEIYPNFDHDDKITSWTLYTAACYDQENKRFYIKKEFATEVTLDFISKNISNLLLDSCDYISGITKSEIPLAVKLK
ncbi:MAG: hypothetical protein ACYC1Q_11795 [Bacteroidia bacterium]